MTIAPPHIVPTGQPPRLQPGDALGPLRVTQDQPHCLRLEPPQAFPRFAVYGGLVALVAGCVRLAAPQVFGSPLNPKGFVYDWGFILLCFSWAAAVVALPMFRLAYTFDGRARAATRRWGFRSHTLPPGAVRSVSVRVGHRGPNEVLVLVLEGDGGDLAVTAAPSDARGLPLIAAAARVARLLGVSLTRAGTPVQSGTDVRAALDGIAPPPAGAAALGDGRDLLINCPACGGKHVPAVSYDHQEQQYGVTHTSSWVKCLACGTHLHSKGSADELFGRTPEQLESVLAFRLSLVARATALLAVLTCLFPWVGFGMALLATLINWRTRGWPRLASRIALAVSVVVTAGMTILINS
jgi:hypothetical protein